MAKTAVASYTIQLMWIVSNPPTPSGILLLSCPLHVTALLRMVRSDLLDQYYLLLNKINTYRTKNGVCYFTNSKLFMIRNMNNLTELTLDCVNSTIV